MSTAEDPIHLQDSFSNRRVGKKVLPESIWPLVQFRAHQSTSGLRKSRVLARRLKGSQKCIEAFTLNWIIPQFANTFYSKTPTTCDKESESCS